MINKNISITIHVRNCTRYFLDYLIGIEDTTFYNILLNKKSSKNIYSYLKTFAYIIKNITRNLCISS